MHRQPVDQFYIFILPSAQGEVLAGHGGVCGQSVLAGRSVNKITATKKSNKTVFKQPSTNPMAAHGVYTAHAQPRFDRAARSCLARIL